MKQLTLGSLFSGSGGFELAGKLCGIKPLWASEIEPFPIRVTTKRLPEVQHLGDIRRIDGTKIPPVDIVAMGSPCTNLSTANAKREGLAGSQSGLFYEAIRIIKEMRKEMKNEYPRFVTWENVPGVFSSSDREDFRKVLMEIINIIAPGASVPAPDKNGWSYADVLVGDGWSLAYRTIDAQYFGVAQRRKRIYLVCDLMSERAGDILFEREGVCRDFAALGCPGESPAGSAADGADAAIAFLPGALKRLGTAPNIELSPTLRAKVSDNSPPAVAIENHPADSRFKISKDGKVQTLSSNMGTGGNNTPMALCLAGNIIDRGAKSGGNGLGVNEEVSFTLNTADRHAVAESDGCHYIVRRLIPQECAMLQGFIPSYCAGLETPEPTEADIAFWAKVFEEHRLAVGKAKKPKTRNQIVKWLRNPHSDSAEWKMWGNGICLQCAVFVLGGIAELIRGEDNS